MKNTKVQIHHKKMMAKVMLSSGISIEEVAKVSGFAIDELRKTN